LTCFKSIPKNDNGDDEDNIVDMIADLLHLAHSRGFETMSIHQKAGDHFIFEVNKLDSKCSPERMER